MGERMGRFQKDPKSKPTNICFLTLAGSSKGTSHSSKSLAVLSFVVCIELNLNNFYFCNSPASQEEAEQKPGVNTGSQVLLWLQAKQRWNRAVHTHSRADKEKVPGLLLLHSPCLLSHTDSNKRFLIKIFKNFISWTEKHKGIFDL